MGRCEVCDRYIETEVIKGMELCSICRESVNDFQTSTSTDGKYPMEENLKTKNGIPSHNLSDEEFEKWKVRGKQRTSFARSRGIVDQKFSDDKTGEQIDITGSIGEYGYCMMLGRDPEKIIRVGVDSGHDDRMFNKRIQIKTTDVPTGKLFANEWLLDKYDFMVLMIVEGPKVRCAGYISTKEFKRIIQSREPDKDARHRKAFTLRQYELNSLSWLPMHAQFGDKWFEWRKTKGRR